MHEKAPLLNVSKREKVGTRYNNRLRLAGSVPAVVYGRGKDPISISLNHRDFTRLVSKGEKIFRLDVPADKDLDQQQMVLLRDLQFDYLGTNIVHADFTRVGLTDRVRTRVSIHLVGEATGLKQAGAILMHPVNELEIECVLTELPDFIEVGIGDLDVGHAISAADVKLPPNMKLLTDAHAIVAQIVIQAEIVVAEATAAPTDAAAGPEVLTAKKPAEGEAAKGAAPAAGAKGAAPAKDAKAAAAKPAAKK